MFYLLPAVFYNIHENSDYYRHALVYVTFIRLLTQDFVSNEDILHANELINYFCRKFKQLYGEKNLTYKLHTHLPAQVVQYGPLHEVSCFPFESNYLNKALTLNLN